MVRVELSRKEKFVTSTVKKDCSERTEVGSPITKRTETRGVRQVHGHKVRRKVGFGTFVSTYNIVRRSKGSPFS